MQFSHGTSEAGQQMDKTTDCCQPERLGVPKWAPHPQLLNLGMTTQFLPLQRASSGWRRNNELQIAQEHF
jgi:hypothetical protein